MAVNGYKFTVLTGGGVGALDAQDGAGLAEGDIAIVMVSGALYLYQLSSTSGAAESSPNVIAPDTNAGTKRWLIQRVPQTNSIPVGSTIAWQGGYYTSGSNAGFTSVLGNSAATINALINADGFYVCDGAALNLAGSPIYNGAGRYLPNLTQQIFIMGGTSAGVLGGENFTAEHNHVHVHDHFMYHSHTILHNHYVDHVHTTGSFTLTTNEMPYHNHKISGGPAGINNPDHVFFTTTSDKVWSNDEAPTTVAGTGYTGGGAAHNHGSTGNASITHTSEPNAADTGGTSSPTTSVPNDIYTSTLGATDNRPNFLSCFYIQKVI